MKLLKMVLKKLIEWAMAEEVVVGVYQMPKARGLPIPSFAYPGDAGADLPLPQDVTLFPGKNSVPTGVCLDIPDGYYVRVVGKGGPTGKGLASFGLENIDEGFIGEIVLIVWNSNIPTADNPGTIFVPAGKAIAALVVTRRIKTKYTAISEEKMMLATRRKAEEARMLGKTPRLSGRLDSSKTGIS